MNVWGLLENGWKQTSTETPCMGKEGMTLHCIERLGMKSYREHANICVNVVADNESKNYITVQPEQNIISKLGEQWTISHPDLLGYLMTFILLLH